MTSPFDGILKKQNCSPQTRLSFPDLCGYYAALRDGVSPAVVARASGLAKITVTYLRHAGEHYGGQLRYPRIAREYESWGHEAFVNHYATPVLVEKLAAAETKPPPPRIGFNARADKRAGSFTFLDKRTGKQGGFTIRLELDSERPGWGWKDHAGPIDPQDPFPTRGDPRAQERLFATSGAAYDFAMLRIFPTDSQIQDGSAEAARDDTYFWSKHPHYSQK